MSNLTTIPEALTACPQWVCWGEQSRDGKPTKVPLNPQTGNYASVREPETWDSFESARERATTDDQVSGVGFVFTDDDPFVGVDLDDCRDAETGQPEPWARQLIEQLDSFTEVSPSGTGFHVYLRGSLPDGGNRSGGIECYETARFFTVTGEWVAGTPTDVHERIAEIETMHDTHIASSATTTSTAPTQPSEAAPTLADDELLSKAMNAKNGPKFTRLWNGNTSGYDSHSEADMALCFLLAFWTGRDATQMDRLFRRSGLYREKWDERHYADGSTYGEGTVARAVSETADVYEPRQESRETDTKSEPTVMSEGVKGASGNPAGFEIEQMVAELKTTVAELGAAVEALEAQNEYLYDELKNDRSKHERTKSQIRDLEERVERGREPWFKRLF